MLTKEISIIICIAGQGRPLAAPQREDEVLYLGRQSLYWWASSPVLHYPKTDPQFYTGLEAGITGGDSLACVIREVRQDDLIDYKTQRNHHILLYSGSSPQKGLQQLRNSEYPLIGTPEQTRLQQKGDKQGLFNLGLC